MPEKVAQTVRVEDVAQMLELGHQLAEGVRPGQLIFLQGQLGAGKTTLVRGILRGMGHIGTVKSPTYTLLEPYDDVSPAVSHLDLYRLQDPAELETLAIRDHMNGIRVCMVEWPQHGKGVLPGADCTIGFEFAGPTVRSVSLHCETELGRSLCECLRDQ